MSTRPAVINAVASVGKIKPPEFAPKDKLYAVGAGITVPILGRIPGVDNLTGADPRQQVWPFTRTSKIARTRDSILLDVLSVYAYLRPETASIFPFPPRSGVPITNEALVAALFSDQMEPDLLVRAGVETPIGIFNRIPDPANINHRGLLDLQSGRPVPGEGLIRLPPPQERGGARVPIRSLVNAILRPGGDFTLWYFPWRLILDFGLATNLDTSATGTSQGFDHNGLLLVTCDTTSPFSGTHYRFTGFLTGIGPH